MRTSGWLVLVALGGRWPCGAPARAEAQQPITFGQALGMVQQGNERWKAADLSVERAQQTRAEFRGRYWPTVGILGGYAHLNAPLYVDLNGLVPLLHELNPAVPIPPLTATVLENNPVRISFAEGWTLFAGGRIRAENRAAQAGVVAAGEQRRSTRQALITELVERYFGRRLAVEIVEVRQRAFETLTRHAQEAERLQEAGQIPRTEVLRAAVARAEAEREYRKAQRDLALATVALQAILATDEPVDPVTPLPTAPVLEPREHFIVAADNTNPGLAHLAAVTEQGRQGITIAKATWFPAVRAFGRQELVQRGLNTTADPDWTVGLVFEWELFNGFGREHRVAAARLAQQELVLQYAGARRDVATLVQSRYDEYDSAIEQYRSLQSSIDLAEESLRAEQHAFAEGVGTSIAVVDAELALSRVQVGRLTAQFEGVVALARLLEASGQSDRIQEYIGQ